MVNHRPEQSLLWARQRSGRYRSAASGRDERLAAHVLAAAEQQRRLGGGCGGLDGAGEDDGVAAIVPVLVAALEMCGGADQHRGAAFGDDVVDLGELVLV